MTTPSDPEYIKGNANIKTSKKSKEILDKIFTTGYLHYEERK
jgi:hypothetical protein